MNEFVDSLVRHAPLLLAAVTLLMALGCGVLSVVRSPAHRQRIGELTLAAVLGWLVLAIIPLPRWLPQWSIEARPAEIKASGSSRLTLRSGVNSAAASGDAVAAAPVIVQPLTIVAQPSEVPQRDSYSAHAGIEDEHIDALPRVDGDANRPEIAVSDDRDGIEGPAIDPTIIAPYASAQVPSTASAQAPTTKPNWRATAGWLYLACAAAAVLWLLIGHTLLLRERFTAAAPPAWLYRLLHNSVSAWRGRLPRLVVSRRSSRPLAWGVWRPIIALPERICHVGNREQLRPILLHEMGHVHRGDARGCLLFELAFPLLFFHPLYWWLRGEVRMAAELVADDWAARQTGKETYVAELVALARGTRPRRLTLLAGTGVLSSPSQFYRRMQMLLTRENPLSIRPSRLWRWASVAGLAVAVAFGAAMAGNSPASGQQPDKPTEKAPGDAAPKAETNGGPTIGVGAAPPAAPAAESNSGPAIGVGAALPPTAKDAPATEPAPGGPSNVATSVTEAPATDAPSTTPVAGGPAGAPGLPGSIPPAGGLPGAGNTTPVAPSVTIGAGSPPTADQLLAEKRKLLDEIQALRAKLHELESKSGGTASGRIDAGMAGYPSASADRAVILTRVDEKGQLFNERWTTDSEGRPSKLIEKWAANKPSGITSASPGVTDGKIAVKVLKDQDGKVFVHTYDAKTGKIIESRQAPVVAGIGLASPPGVDAAAELTTPKPEPTPEYRAVFGIAEKPAPAPSPYNPETSRPPHSLALWESKTTSSVSDRPIDLVALATNYADAISAVELAKAKLAEAEQAGQSGELRSRRVSVENAVRKGNLLRRIAEVAMTGAKQQADRVAQLRAAGAISASEANEIESRVEILKQIIDAGGGGADSQPDAPKRP